MGLPVKSLRIFQKSMFKKAYIVKNQMSFLTILQHFRLILQLKFQVWNVLKRVLKGFFAQMNLTTKTYDLKMFVIK